MVVLVGKKIAGIFFSAATVNDGGWRPMVVVAVNDTEWWSTAKKKVAAMKTT